MKKLIFFTVWLSVLAGCSRSGTPLSTPSVVVNMSEEKTQDYSDIKRQSYRSHRAIPARRSRYEGSLWEDEASWGNLLRDHRARFRGDLVKIVNLQDVISVPKPEEKKPTPKTPTTITEGEATAAKINELIDAVTGETKAEKEQNEVLGSLRSISAYVQSVLPNGNMIIVGEKVDYRQQNSIRYVTTVRGIIRPADVNDNNEVPAIKLARFEPKIKRQMQAKNLRNLSPVLGAQKAGLLDKLSHIVTPTKKKKTTKIGTR